MIGQLIAAMLGTITFSLLYGVPKNYYVCCGLIGMSGWGIYLVLNDRAGSNFAVFTATMLVVFLSRLAAVCLRCPATLFLIPGIFPLVPGTGVYWTTYYIVTDELSMALRTGYNAIATAVSLVLGIVFIFEIPQKFFGWLGSRFSGLSK